VMAARTGPPRLTVLRAGHRSRQPGCERRDCCMSRLPSESASLATRSAARAAVAVAAILVLAACGGGGGASEGTNGNGVACADPMPDQLLGPAVRAYLDGREPRPLRFLSAAGSDSAMPNAGMLVLQDRGPTYFYPPDSAGRETVRQRLGETY